METKLEALEDNRVKVTTTVDVKEVDKQAKISYKDLAYRYNFPGFRRGKAPRPVVDNALGADTVRATITDALINDSYPRILEDENLFPIGQPQFEETEDLVVIGKPFTFTFTLEVKPDMELSSYDPVEIELPFQTATDAELEDQIMAFREHYGEFEDADAKTKIAADTYPELAIKATDEKGESIASLESDARLYAVGAGLMSKAFDDEIMGMKKGDTKSFELAVPEDETAILLSTYAGTTIKFEVTCNVVKKRVLPELTDEWAKEQMGFETVDDLRKNVSESIEAQKASMIPRLKENRCLDELAKRVEGEPPASMCEEEETRLLQDFFTQLQNQGLNFDAYLKEQGLTSDEFKEDVKKQAADNVKQELALDAWARHNNIEATPAEISNEFVVAGLEDPKATEAQWRQEGRIHLVRQGVLRAKAIREVMDGAKVTEVDYAAEDEEKTEEKPKKKASKKSTAKKTDKEGAKATKKAAKAEEKADEKAEKAEEKADAEQKADAADANEAAEGGEA